jgi:hypothetical protein
MKDVKSLLEKFKVRKDYNLISLPTIQLSPEEADQFITYIIDQSAMKQYARIERMGRPQKPIRALGFGNGHFLYPADHFDESKYKKQFVEEKIILSTQEVRGCIPIFDKDIEDLSGIVNEAEYKDALMKIITAKIANELEEAFWMSDLHGLNGFPADDIRSLWDGWRYRIVNGQIVTDQYWNKVAGGSHVLDACEGGESGSPFQAHGMIAEPIGASGECCLWEFKYNVMLKTMPSIYKANNGLANMAFLNSDLVTQDYLNALSQRGTPLGDAVFLGSAQPQYGRVKIIDAPLMPTNLGDPTATPSTDGVIGAGIYTDVLLTPKNNLIIGIQRDIRIESERKASDEATYIFYSMRACPSIENINACVLLRCLEHAC